MKGNNKQVGKKRKQHITPVLYLKQFQAEGFRLPHIWIGDKTRKDTYYNSIDNTGYKKDFYTLEEIKDKYAWDDYYTNIETKMAKVVKKTAIACENRMFNSKSKIISEQIKQELAFFIAIQMTRGERFIDFAYSSKNIFRKMFEEYVGLTLTSTFPEKIDIADVSTNPDFLQSFMLYIHNKSWIFYYTLKDSFITSDEPVVLFDIISNKQGLFNCGLIDINTIVCFPLTPKILLVMYNIYYKKSITRCDRQRFFLTNKEEHDALIRRHNKGQFTQCNRFIYSNKKELIEDLTDLR